VNVQFINQQAGNYTIRLVDKAGTVLYSTVVNNQSINSVHSLALSSAIAAGTYQLEIVSQKGGERTMQNVVISNR
jgi:hypothetical protein